MPGLRPFWVLCLLAPSLAFGSANAFRTLVVVNTNSAASVELGAYYAEKHGIPDHQICSVGIATNLTTLTPIQFRNWLRNPIYSHLAAEGLAGRIDFVVLCQDFPTRINDIEGIPAALFYGYQNAPAYNEGGIGCNLPEYTSNAYFRAERALGRPTAGTAPTGSSRSISSPPTCPPPSWWRTGAPPRSPRSRRPPSISTRSAARAAASANSSTPTRSSPSPPCPACR
jgi:hypothetical protein